MPACEFESDPTLRDLLAHVEALEQQLADLATKSECWAAEMTIGLHRLERQDRAEVAFPTEAEAWEGCLHRLFGTMLTPQSIPVCARLLIGMRAKEIASDLQRPISTVKSQVGAIRDRFGLANSEEIPLHVFQQFWRLYASELCGVPGEGRKGR